MTNVTEKIFLEKLYEVVYKLSSIGKSQNYRFKTKWDAYLSEFGKPHLVRPIKLEKDKFLDDIEFRINVLKNVEQSLVDGFYSIKTLLQTLYHSYFNDSEQLKRDYSVDDQLILKYMVAKEILGNLIQYNRLDHETVPLKYNIIARNYVMMKLREIDDTEILSNLKKLNINEIKVTELHDLMKQIEKDGIINITKKDGGNIYKVKKELELSKEGKSKFLNTLEALVSWPTQFWRSMYNIRELNVTITGCKHDDFLQKVLSKSATQGFSPAHYVFKNLITYYEKIRDES
ncbi:MAG: hypothetical protein ACFFBP_03125 [Promethearchaeota archaeon]